MKAQTLGIEVKAWDVKTTSFRYDMKRANSEFKTRNPSYSTRPGLAAETTVSYLETVVNSNTPINFFPEITKSYTKRKISMSTTRIHYCFGLKHHISCKSMKRRFHIQTLISHNSLNSYPFFKNFISEFSA